MEESGYPGGFLHAPISRRGSRRSSRYSRWETCQSRRRNFSKNIFGHFTFSLLSIGHSHSGSVDLQDQERSVASGKREVGLMFGLYLLKIFKTKFVFQKVSLDLSEGRGSSFSSEDSAAPASKPRAASLDTRLEVGGRCGGGWGSGCVCAGVWGAK